MYFIPFGERNIDMTTLNSASISALVSQLALAANSNCNFWWQWKCLISIWTLDGFSMVREEIPTEHYATFVGWYNAAIKLLPELEGELIEWHQEMLKVLEETPQTWFKKDSQLVCFAYALRGQLGGGKKETVNVKPEFYAYSTDVVKLATSKKQEEVTNSNNTLFGIELEFTHSEYSLKELYECTHMGVFKYDSSVDGEFVTLPYTYEDMVTKLELRSSSFNKLLSNNGSYKVGMHVHVSRKGLTLQQIKNLDTLLNPSSEEGQDYWCRVAGRDIKNYRYCSIEPIPSNRYGRYLMLNLENKATVEFRMFISPTSVGQVIDNLKVVSSLVEFAKNSSDLQEFMNMYPTEGTYEVQSDYSQESQECLNFMESKDTEVYIDDGINICDIDWDDVVSEEYYS